MQFKNPLDPENLAIQKAIKQWIRVSLQLSDDNIVITVSEIKCCGENCPHIETCVTVWQTPPLLLKIPKPLVYVRKYDVEIAIKELLKS